MPECDGRTDRRTDGRTDGHSSSGYTSACIACYANALVKIKFRNISDDVSADRMNTGLDWMWVEILNCDGLDWVSKLVDWVGLDL